MRFRGVTRAATAKGGGWSAIAALPSSAIGILWSNQNSERFGFRVHFDSDSPSTWQPDEIPASQSALNVRGGMADDHLNLAVGVDGTLYAAVKTSYDTVGYPKIALLIRRPNGIWDDLYEVDEIGTRPFIVLNETIDPAIGIAWHHGSMLE